MFSEIFAQQKNLQPLFNLLNPDRQCQTFLRKVWHCFLPKIRQELRQPPAISILPKKNGSRHSITCNLSPMIRSLEVTSKPLTMKFSLISLLAILLPALHYAQSDWCSCMETISYEDVSNYVSQTSKQQLILTSSTENNPIALDAGTNSRRPELRPPTPEPTPQPVVSDEKESTARGSKIRAASNARKTALKKRSKLFKKRIKKRKRARKYRGKCPAF